MKFQFTHQQFQADAANSICDVFSGQPKPNEFRLTRDDEVVIGSNADISLTDADILRNLRAVQNRNGLPLSATLDGRNFSVEMETGTGKTYTYIKTMYELNRRYGWRKFIVVVPSVAIREGVKKTFEVTAEHFADEYHARIRHFVYRSSNLERIKSFVDGAGIWAMIVNVQAFGARSADARRMLHELDEFQSRVPIDVIAQVRPIVIVDEPQSVEGEVAAQKIGDFKPLMILRYSATHRKLYNLVYRLDALEAYKRRMVKKIAVKGLEIRNDAATGYVFFERVNLSKKNPTATVTFNRKTAKEIKRVTKKLRVGDNLYKLSGGIDAYRNFIVTAIDGADKSLEFLNGRKLFVGQTFGDANEEAFRRVQIRETIQSHLERERQLYGQGIKVLSLFFIDEVAKYRADDGRGLYAEIFEQEYADAVKNFVTDATHQKYLQSIDAKSTHAGYFSVDKKNRPNSDDVDAYDLIMRDKERLLDMREPVRFIFSHSALREGWDNPNVFQICALKQSSSDIRRRQEVGRGMRLCVNQDGERQEDRDVNVLTVVANESYETFAAGLQTEIAEAVGRPLLVESNFFVDKKLAGHTVDENLSRKIYNALVRRDYLDDDCRLTENFFNAVDGNTVSFGDELNCYRDDLLKLLAGVGGHDYEIENAQDAEVTVTADATKFNAKNFQELWSRISRKTSCRLDFDSADFVKRAVDALNKSLLIPETKISVAHGTLTNNGTFEQTVNGTRDAKVTITSTNAQVDLVGKLVSATGLTRRDVTAILQRIDSKTFDGFGRNPEQFLSEATRIINVAKSAQIVDNVTYTPLDECYDAKIFFVERKGRLNSNAIATAKNVYDYLIYDSGVEKKFAADMEADAKVSVYAKLPRDFLIPTPIGDYNPDWAIVFGDKIFFVVETKGSVDPNQLRGTENFKIDCARKHFAALGNEVAFEFVDSYATLVKKISLHATVTAPK
ncbi:MAG: DEAD/DEAH box helicase family protein [Selenomonadaceae bacterium]|nr:DEAD/DEAH box helicase family protein [Selenomonadaceae bacterium]